MSEIDPYISMLAHTVLASLSERGRRWPLKLGAIKTGIALGRLSSNRLTELLILCEAEDRKFLLEELKKDGIE